jgi:malate dehydrogenase (oxaloacetate-decarboxylating)
MMIRATTPGFSISIRLEIPNQPGILAKVIATIAKTGGNIGDLDIAGFKKDRIIRDIVVSAADNVMLQQIIAAVKKLPDIGFIRVTDRTMMFHHGGKIEIRSKIPLKTRDDLAMAYTPGVARVSMAIHENPELVYDLTIKRNTVAIVTDGSAVLGLGDIGPRAALPVMEGKAMLFKTFGHIDAFPICLDTKNTEQIISTVKFISPGFGGINLEDIAAPRCFEIEDRLVKELDIPVFHDDQHGTATVILAGLLNALKIVGKDMKDIQIVVNGLGAAGASTIKLLLACGVGHIIGCDTKGILYQGRQENMNPIKEDIATKTNQNRIKGSLTKALQGADVFIGVSAGNLLHGRDIKKMAQDPIVFAMANPDPEIMPEEAAPYARIMATGRSDYHNQINNVLCFPGLFRGVFDCNARIINREMLIAAARAIASCIAPEELMEDYIIPSVFNHRVQENVAHAVREAALATGVARKEHKFDL